MAPNTLYYGGNLDIPRGERDEADSGAPPRDDAREEDPTTWTVPGEGERWLVELTYPETYRKVVLALLAATYASPEAMLLVRADRLFLASARFGQCANGNQVWGVSDDLVRVVNAVGHQGQGLHPGLRLANVFVERGPRLERWRLSPRLGGVALTTRCARYRQLTAPGVAEVLLGLQTRDPEVRSAFELGMGAVPSWRNMHIMHEIIRRSCPRALPDLEAAAVAESLGSGSPRTKFRALLQCAQHHKVVGIAASRHYATSPVPKTVVHPLEASLMMDCLFREWLLYRVRQVLISDVCAVLSGVEAIRRDPSSCESLGAGSGEAR